MVNSAVLGTLVRWRTEWDSEQDAIEFASCYQGFIRDTYKKVVGEDLLAVSDSKRMRIFRSKNAVVIEATSR